MSSIPRPLLIMDSVARRIPPATWPDEISARITSVSENVVLNCDLRILDKPTIFKFAIDGETFEISPQDLRSMLREFTNKKAQKPTEPPNRFENLEDA